jgi:type VI secretion system secreted protein Hcp
MDFIILDAGSDIKGECTIDGYKDKISILSFSHGIAQQITSDASNQKRTSGKPNHQDLTVSKFYDLSSINFIQQCNAATPLKLVKLIVAQNEDGKVNEIIHIDMSDVIISSISVGGGGGGVPQETMTLNYSKITWTYKPQAVTGDAKGKNEAKWSLSTNKAE